MDALLLDRVIFFTVVTPNHICFEGVVYQTTVLRFINDIFSPGGVDSLLVGYCWPLDQIVHSLDDEMGVERIPAPQILIKDQYGVLQIKAACLLLVE